MRLNGNFNFPLGLIKYIAIIETSHYVKHLWEHLQRYVLPISDQLSHFRNFHLPFFANSEDRKCIEMCVILCTGMFRLHYVRYSWLRHSVSGGFTHEDFN